MEGRPAQDALTAAVRLLSHRARSRHELCGLLTRKGYAPTEVEGALQRCAELGYLDDARFAQHRATVLLRDGRLGPQGVEARLRAHGLTEEQARRALEDAANEVGFDALSVARATLERRRLLSPADPRSRARAARLLQSRGFPAPVIESLLGVETSPGDE